MRGTHKPFNQKLSDKYDTMARDILIPILASEYPTIRENDPNNWALPDAECDNFYHELQVVLDWKFGNKPTYIIIWGRKYKYLNKRKPTLFWALSSDCMFGAGIESKVVKQYPITFIESDKTKSGYEEVIKIPFEAWTTWIL